MVNNYNGFILEKYSGENLKEKINDYKRKIITRLSKLKIRDMNEIIKISNIIDYNKLNYDKYKGVVKSNIKRSAKTQIKNTLNGIKKLEKKTDKIYKKNTKKEINELKKELKKLKKEFRDDYADLFDYEEKYEKDRQNEISFLNERYNKYNIGKIREIYKEYLYRIKPKIESEINFEDYIRCIKAALLNIKEQVIVKIRTISGGKNEGQQDKEWKSINRRADGRDDLLYKINKYLSAEDKTKGFGSDKIVIQGDIELDLSEFAIFIYKNAMGGRDSAVRSIKTDDFMGCSYKSSNNNCLIEIFRKNNFNNEKSITSDKIRRVLGFDKDNLLNTNEHLPKIEKYFKLGCNVYGYLKGEFNLIREYKGDDKKIDIYYDAIEEHYSIIYNFKNKDDKKIKNKKEEKITEYTDVFFDFETVSDKEGKLHAYYFSIFCDKKVIYYPSIEDKIDDINIEKGDVVRVFINTLCELYKEKGKHLRLIGYNNSRFDNFLLLNELLEREETPNLLYVKNSILRMRTSFFTTFDLCRFTMTSLKNACNDFKTPNKKVDGFDHKLVQENYQKGDLKKWMFINFNKLKEYGNGDVICLSELYNIVRDSVSKLSGSKIEDHLTIAGLAVDKWKNGVNGLKYINNEKITKINTEEELNVYDFIKKAQFAGRSQMFKVANCKKNIIVIDATSLYPFVMEGGNKNYICNFPDPTSDMIYTEEFIENLEGYYFCDIVSQPKKNIIPYRSEDKSVALNWSYNKQINNIVLTAQDIRMIKKYNGEINVYNGIYWSKSTNSVFKSYVECFKEEKKRQDELSKNKNPEYNQSLRECCKLFLNSLSGKVNESLHDDVVLLSKDDDKLYKFINEYKQKDLVKFNNNYLLLQGKNEDREKLLEKNKSPIQLGVYVYSWARSWMYDNIISKSDAYGMDTDSYFMEEEEYEKLYKSNPAIFGDEFGLFKVENLEKGQNKKWTDNYFLMSKSYGLFSENELHNKTRFKGIKQDDRLMTEKQLEEYNKLVDNYEKFYYYEKLDKVYITVDKEGKSNTFIRKIFYENLLKDKKVYLLSNMLCKKNLEITNIFITKTISI